MLWILEFRNKVNFKFDAQQKLTSYITLLTSQKVIIWRQRCTNKSVILLKTTIVSTILLISQKVAIYL